MKCNKCGAENDESSKSCGKCGHDLSQEATHGSAFSFSKEEGKRNIFIVALVGIIVVGLLSYQPDYRPDESVSREMKRTRESLESECANSINSRCAETWSRYIVAKERLIQEAISQQESYCQKQSVLTWSCSRYALETKPKLPDATMDDLFTWLIKLAVGMPGALDNNGLLRERAALELLRQSGVTDEIARAILQQQAFEQDPAGVRKRKLAINSEYEVIRSKNLCDQGFGDGIFDKPYCAVTHFFRSRL